MLTTVEPTLMPGAVVGGYQLLRVVGEGGMSVVWAARSLSSGERRALKFLKAKDGKGEARLLREARATMGLTHPAVARTFSVEVLPTGQPFIVMELLQGETLRARLERDGKLPLSLVASVLGSVVEAVVAAHALGVVHRDLKPENVFLVHGDPRPVRVIDFGIAKEIKGICGDQGSSLGEPSGASAGSASLTATGAMLGTPFYMAPEQIFGDADVDHRADVWALGIIVFECVAGRRPTDARGVGQVLKLIAMNALPSLATAWPEAPGDLVALVDRMLSRDRDARPPLHEVLDLLRSLSSTAGSGSRPSAPPVSRSLGSIETIDTRGGPLDEPPRAPSPRPRSVVPGLAVALATLAVALVARGLASRPSSASSPPSVVALPSEPDRATPVQGSAGGRPTSPLASTPLTSLASPLSPSSAAPVPRAHAAPAALAAPVDSRGAAAGVADREPGPPGRSLAQPGDAGGAPDGNVLYFVTGDRL